MNLLVVINGNDIGNSIMATPLISSLGKAHDVYILLKGDPFGTRDIFYDERFVRDVFDENDFAERCEAEIDQILCTYMTESPKAVDHICRIVGKRIKDARSKLLKPRDFKQHDWQKIPQWQDKPFGGNEACYSLRLAVHFGLVEDYPLAYANWNREAEFPDYDIGFHSGSKAGRWVTKRWPHFRELAEALPGKKIAVVGGPADPIIEWPSNCTDYTQKLAIADTAAVIKRCKLFVANDSGILHLANALGIPTIAVWGWTGIKKNRPHNPGCTIVELGLGCQPCFRTRHSMSCPSGKGNVDCLRDLTPTVVREHMLRVLEGGDPEAAQPASQTDGSKEEEVDVSETEQGPATKHGNGQADTECRATSTEQTQPIRLNLGCGTDIRRGYVNIDVRALPGVAVVSSVEKLDYADGSVDEVYARDILEHFPIGKTVPVLREWLRVLKPGGKLTVRCPDLRTICHRYMHGQHTAAWTAKLLYGNQDYEGNFHYTAFDRGYLTECLRSAGQCHVVSARADGNNFILEVAKGAPRQEVPSPRVSGRVLVCAGAGIGNIMHTTPVMRAAKELGYTVDVLLKHPYGNIGELFANWDVVDRILTDPRHVNEGHYVRILVANCYSRNPFRSRRVIPRPKPRWDRDNEGVYEFQMARQLGYRGKMPATHVEPSARTFDLPSDKRIIGFHPGCKTGGWVRKRWPYFTKLAELLQQQGAHVVVVGTQADRQQKPWPDGVEDFTDKLSIGDTAALISQCDTFISNDSGIAHVAAAVGVPTFVIFGPTSLTKNCPLQDNVIPVCLNLGCQPCQFSQHFKSCKHLSCLRNLSPEYVLNYLNRPLETRRLDNYMQKCWIPRRIFQHVSMPVHQERWQAVSRLVTGEKILDLGCATGEGTQLLREKFPERTVLGVDGSELAIQFAKRRYEKDGFCVGLIGDLPFEDQSFDTVHCGEVLHSCSDPTALLTEAARLARARVIISTTDQPSPDFMFKRCHTEAELTRLLGSFFQEVEVVRAGGRLLGVCEKPKKVEPVTYAGPDRYTEEYFRGPEDDDEAKPVHWAAGGYREFRQGQVHYKFHRMLRIAERYVRGYAGKKVLDCGCGRGEMLRLLVRAGCATVVGLDFSEAAVELARSFEPAATVNQMNLTDMRFVKEFDIVFLLDVVEHIPAETMAQVYERVRAALVDGGTVVIQTPFFVMDNQYDPADHHPVTKGMHCNKQTFRGLRQDLQEYGFRITIQWRGIVLARLEGGTDEGRTECGVRSSERGVNATDNG